jgi:hypothetical protein
MGGIEMRTAVQILGRRLDLALRARRRRFVTIFYAVYLGLLAFSFLISSQSGAAFMTIEFTVLIGPVLGGYFWGKYNLFGSQGIVEPFAGNTILERARQGNRFTLFNLSLSGTDLGELRNDERAMARRDRAHYAAYRILGTLASITFLLEYLEHSVLQPGLAYINLSEALVSRIIFVLLALMYLGFLTFPAAIILWTEPDMEDME